jgi:transcriptional regulator with XRE-family HTH domain
VEGDLQAHTAPRRRFLHPVTPSAEECASARAAVGWSQERLARAAGVTTRTILDFELGLRTPRAGTLIAIRRAFRKAGLSMPTDFASIGEQAAR